MTDVELQPVLFDDWPAEPELVERAKEFIHNGKLVLRDDERCVRIIRAVLAGVPKRRIMREYRVASESIDQVRHEFEKSGRLRTISQRMVEEWSELFLLGSEYIREKIMERTLPANVAAFVVVNATDKIQLLTGLPTERIESKRVSVTEDQVRRAFEELTRVRSSLDVPSSVSVENSHIIKHQVSNDTGPDTGLGCVPSVRNGSRIGGEGV